VTSPLLLGPAEGALAHSSLFAISSSLSQRQPIPTSIEVEVIIQDAEHIIPHLSLSRATTIDSWLRGFSRDTRTS